MADTLDENGLTVSSLTEVSSSITTKLQGVYGSDINVDSNSPDGQAINIFSQVSIDQREVLLDIYNMFSVENAYGTTLDNLVSLNGIARKAGTYTTAPVEITVNQAVSLVGQDVGGSGVFTLQDTSGYQWALESSYAFGAAGSATLTFVCTTIGAISPAVGSITQMATAVLGVTAVNNPSVSGVSVGTDEQSDASLKITRAKSFQLPSTGPLASITGSLLNAGAVDAITYENNTGSAVGVIPAHSVYVVVNPGSLFNAQIASAIGGRKMPGCGTYGSVSYSYNAGANIFTTLYWDVAVAQPLYVKATLLSKVSGATYDIDGVKAAIAAIVYTLGQTATIGDIMAAIVGYNSNIIPTVLGVCATSGGTYTDTLAPAALKNYFTISVGDITLS